jgi:hypothetical protein
MSDDLARIVDSLGERLNQSEVRRHRSVPSERGLSKAIGVLDKLRNERGEYAAANALR